MDRSAGRSFFVLPLALLVTCAACVQTASTDGAHSAGVAGAAAAGSPSIAHELLDIEASALPTSPAMRGLLDATILRAVSRVQASVHELRGMGGRERALRTLQIIASSLRDGHFVYPGRGGVPTLHDSLASVNVDQAGLDRLLAARENDQAASLIRSNPKAVFHIADCDIFSFLYVAIGQTLVLPISMVDLPAAEAGTSHAYVRLRTADGGHVDWEAMSGMERNARVQDARFFEGGPKSMEQAQAAGAFAVPMSRPEMLGHAYVILGGLWQKLGSDERALVAYQAAVNKRPNSPVAYNEVAWLLATSPDPLVRNPGQAVGVAENLVSLWPSANHLDTLAAAYAAAGRTRDAVNVQVRAIATVGSSDPLLAGFRQRCAMYLRSEPYIQPRREELEKELGRADLMDSSWRELALEAAKTPVQEPALPQECAYGRRA